MTHDLDWWLVGTWKAHGQPSSRLNWTFFVICYGFGVIRRNVYSLAIFAGSRRVFSQILPGQGRPPSTILGISKLETLGYPMVKTASLCIRSFWHNTGVWQTDGYIIAYTEVAKLALRRAVKTGTKSTPFLKSLNRTETEISHVQQNNRNSFYKTWSWYITATRTTYLFTLKLP